MSGMQKSLILFSLNWLDAQLTLLWIRAGVATEGNALMAYLLDHGDATFLFGKLLVGACVAFIFYRWAHLRLARFGVSFALALYAALMFVHGATGLVALERAAPADMLLTLLHQNRALLIWFN